MTSNYHQDAPAYHGGASAGAATQQQQTSYLAHAAELQGKLKLFPYSEMVAEVPCVAPNANDLTSYCLYIGHIRFETTPNEIKWLLRETCKVSTVKIESRGKGGFAVFLRNENDMTLVRTLHKRLLLDHSGVWYAAAEDEVTSLQEYAAGLAYIKRQNFRLPRDCMTVEEVKNKPRPSYDRQQPQQPAQTQQQYAGNPGTQYLNSAPQQQQQQAPSYHYHMQQHQQSARPTYAAYVAATMGSVVPQQQGYHTQPIVSHVETLDSSVVSPAKSNNDGSYQYQPYAQYQTLGAEQDETEAPTLNSAPAARNDGYFPPQYPVAQPLNLVFDGTNQQYAA